MQAVKKLVLVDELNREYKQLQRPAVAVANTDRSLQLSDTLHSYSISDNRKVREYFAALHRYLHTRKEVPEEAEVEPNLGTFVLPQPRSFGFLMGYHCCGHSSSHVTHIVTAHRIRSVW